MASEKEKVKVLVTGATGYLASHIVAKLLAEGYPVRGTIRSLKKAAHLKAMIEKGLPLELVEAELQDAASWPAAVAGCTYVIHTASPVGMGCPDHLGEELMVKPAVNGTLNVIKAAAAAGVKRVVMTSSLAAAASVDDYVRNAATGKALTPEDWNTPDAPTPYMRSKVRAELAAWDFIKTPEALGMELVTLLPGVCFGPSLSENLHEGLEDVLKFLRGQAPLVPAIMASLVDVRDVADAHVKAITSKEAAGQRFLLVQDSTDFHAISIYVAATFRPLGYPVSDRRLPDFLVPLVGLFMLPIWRARRIVGLHPVFDVSKATRVLGFKAKSCQDATVGMIVDAIERGHLPKTPAYEDWAKTRAQEQGTQL